MRNRDESQVLAPLERELYRDPVLHELTTRLAQTDGRRGPLAAHGGARRATQLAHSLLVVGLVTMLLGCFTVSPSLVGTGICATLVALALAARPTAGPHPGS